MRIDFPDNATTRQLVDTILAQYDVMGVPVDAPQTSAFPSILTPLAKGYTALLVPNDLPPAALTALEQVPGLAFTEP